MVANQRKRPPDGLGSAGRAKWREVQDSYLLDPAETAILLQICRISDELEALQAELSANSVLEKGSRNQVIISPLIQEIRLTSLALAKLVKALDLPHGKASPVRRGRLASVENIARKAAGNG